MRLWQVMLLAAVAAVGGHAASGKNHQNKVKLAVYYESLCPDSKKFITQQLALAWQDLRGVFELKLVPFGKASYEKKNGKLEFTCQHGADECYGNKVQSCILKYKPLVDTEKVGMVVCLMSQENPDKSLQTCLTKIGKTAEMQRLKNCADSEEGSNLLASNGNKTNIIRTPLSFVPTIVINENYDTSYQEEALTNLKGLICRTALTKPAACM